jgi:hypothetical protein
MRDVRSGCRISVAILMLVSAVASVSFAGAEEKLASPASDGGWVRLSLADYDRLLRASRRPEKAPLEAAITSTVSQLDATGASPRLTTALEFLSLSDKPQVLTLPDVGVLYESEVAGEGAAVSVSESGAIEIRLARRGRFTVKLKSVPSRSERAGSVTLAWGVPDSPSNRFTATLPGGHESVTLSGGSVDVTATPGGPVRVSGTLRRGETARLAYAVAAARAPEEKLIASASESRLYRLGEKSLGVASRVRIEVLRGTLHSFSVDADPDLTVTSAWAAGNTVTSFERDSNRPGRFVLTLARGVTGGSAEVFWLLERDGKTRDSQREIALPEIGLPDFLRGETAVAVISPRPLVVEETKGKREGYERIDESDLPPELKEMADSTVLLALRRVGTATPALSVQVLAFPDASGLAGVIDRGRILTIAARDGTRIDRWQLDLQTRESLIRLPLPAGAELWSLQVDGKPARPLTEQGQLVVSLGRGEKAARARRIEVVVAIPGALPVAGRGTRTIALPKLPFPVTHADWDLFLPESAQYRYAGGSVAPAPEAPVVAKGVVAGGVEGGAVAGAASGLEKSASASFDEIGTGTGRLSGRALDDNGKPLPGATVTIVRQEGGVRQSRATDAGGYFLFTDLPVGTYRLHGELSGFAVPDRVVQLTDGLNLGADLKMKLDALAETVTVTGEAPLIDTTHMSTGSNFTLSSPTPQAQSRRAAAKEANASANVYRQVLSDEERASLQRTSETGVASIAVELPTEGKRLHFEGNLLVEEAASLELEVRPVKRGWFR